MLNENVEMNISILIDNLKETRFWLLWLVDVVQYFHTAVRGCVLYEHTCILTNVFRLSTSQAKWDEFISNASTNEYQNIKIDISVVCDIQTLNLITAILIIKCVT